jgi:hypothetical protein
VPGLSSSAKKGFHTKGIDGCRHSLLEAFNALASAMALTAVPSKASKQAPHMAIVKVIGLRDAHMGVVKGT